MKRIPVPVSAGLYGLAGLALSALFFLGCGGQSESSPASDEAEAGDSQSRWEDSAALDPDMARAGVTAKDLAGPSEPPVDYFHPAKNQVKPALGGRVIMHVASEPPNLNFAIENSAVIHWVHYSVHEGLLHFNMSTWEMEPRMATAYDIEDTVILAGGRGENNSNIVYGRVTEEGEEYVVTSGSSANPMSERRIPKSEVERIDYGTVFTFHLRDDATWHDGEKFDAEDVYFSWELYQNPHVDCDEKRYIFGDQVLACDVVDPQTVRFFYDRQFFKALEAFDLSFSLLPSHLYNLLDKTNKDYNPNATELERGEYINDNPHNFDFVGLGAYKLTTWERGQYLEAEKWDGYFEKDPRKSGYLDILRWRYIDDDNLAFQALLNGEIDIFDRVKSEDFMGAATQQDVFVKKFYKAFTYTGNLGYNSWNMYNPKLSDVRVRTALAYGFDVKDWIRTNYQGLALVATGSQFRFGPAYNREVDCYPYDVTKAQELLADAGWFDRNGNGIVDKDGVELTIEALMPSGNKASETFLQKLQESYEKIGVKITIQPYEWATFLEKILDRDFEACNLAWVLNDVESDPYALWHSEEADPDRRTSNHAGLADDLVDELIEKARMELDPEKRHELMHRLHARIYELQPYLFGWNVPRKIAFNQKLRGVRLYKFAPGYLLKDIYYEEGTPGTRPFEPGA